MGHTSNIELVGSYFFVVLGAGFLLLVQGWISSKPKWPRVGHSPGVLGWNATVAVEDFKINGRKLLREGYKKWKDQNFVIRSISNDQLVLAPKFLSEVRMLPENKLSHELILHDYMVAEHIGAEMAMGDPQHIDVVRGPLTRQLKRTVPIMQREYFRTSEGFFAQLPKDSNVLPVYTFCYATVAGITSTLFVGEELAHGGEWSKIVMEYFPEAWRIRNALKPWPKFLRPLVKPFLVPNNQLETILTRADKYLDEPIHKRRDPNNDDVDILKFLSEYNEPTRKVVLQTIGVIVGALNTSTHAITQAIYDLCTYPEYIAEVRAEALEALSEEGGWTVETTKKLRILDSFLKESLRLAAPEGLAITRMATSTFSLSDGTVIPKGTHVAFAGEAMALDPEFYPEPDRFDGRRFLTPDGHFVSPDRQFSGIEPGNGMWGSGRLTCPGRHYASAMAKIIVANLVIKYDISFPPGQTKAKPGTEDDANFLPDLTQMIIITPRS